MREEMIHTICEYLATQPIEKAWLFGSFARGDEREDSDVDLLVDIDQTNASVGLLQFCHIMNELSDRLGRRVDLVVNGTLLPFAEKTANQDKQLIYERNC